MQPSRRSTPAPALAPPSRQRGAIAIMMGISLVVLLGALGLAIDGGRLYVNKAELQSAADACALAAAAELNCTPIGIGTCPASFLQNAEAAGQFAALRNRANLQAGNVSVASADVRFNTTLGPNASYLSRAGGASPNSRFAMCTARTSNIAPVLMGLLGAGPSNVDATAVATLAPGQNFCTAAPIGICKKTAAATAPNYGYIVGEWIKADFNGSGTGSGNGNGTPDDLTGNFRWVQFSGSNSTTAINDQLAGISQVCGVRINDSVVVPGGHQGAKEAYNTRFGVYQNGNNAYTAATVPPDRSGYAYPNKNPGSPVIPVPAAGSASSTAYLDYRARHSAGTAFIQNQYAGGNASGSATQASDYTTYGKERRLIPVPVIDCAAATPVILSTACVLMLNPMNNGNGGQTVYLEFRGNGSAASSPCRTSGLPGGAGANGPLVPTLVQ
ncbi:MAG: pilus assembly protein TadG-related protein [Rhizobacter sp.]